MVDSQDRLELATSFLTEAVFRSRARQAASTSILGVDLNAEAGPGNCGLGEKAAVELDLSDRGAELFSELWPEPLSEESLLTLEATLSGWVRKHDALDRKRNHFLRDFRQEHGFDRKQYEPETRTAFEVGLDAVNAEVQGGLTLAASKLLASQ